MINIAKKLHALPTGHSDRIKSLRLPLQGDKSATLVSVCSPTLQADSAVKEALYGELYTVTTRIDPKDKLIILGDFNARVGRDSQPWKGALGKYGLANCNDNGRLLLQFCSQHQLTSANTLFQQQDRFKTNWRHPRSKHWHLLDYILVRQRDARDAVHQSHAQRRLLHRPQTCEACILFQATSQGEGSTNQETPGAPTPPTRDHY